LLFFANFAYSAKTCYDCHQNQKKEYSAAKIIHQPVKDENCEVCHKRHGFSQQLILKDDTAELCYGCHTDLKEKFASGVKHFPLEKGLCWDCHDPHASDKPGLLRKGPEGADDPGGCLICHKDDLSQSFGASAKHPPFEKLQCLTCHQPHNSAFSGLLLSESTTLCFSCHEKDDKKLIAAHKDKNTASLKCDDCHSGHSTNKPALLSGGAHKPFASGDCSICHSPPDSAGKVTFEAGVTPGQLCANCHDAQVQASKKNYPHAAVSADNCNDCHSPHSSRYGKLLKKPEQELCTECHTNIITSAGKTPHPPALTGECHQCHEIHGSDNKSLVKNADATLCLGCHKDFAAARDSASTIHAGAEDCLACHSPHEGETPAILKNAPQKICVDCHAVEPEALASESGHQPYLTGDCGGCHLPHYSNTPHLVKPGKNDLCLNCHADIGTRVKMGFPHPPATEDCLGCHSPHYSKNKNLLSSPEKELCANCHDYDSLSINKKFSHPPAREGDCSGCHNPHGATTAKLVTGRMTKTSVDGRMVAQLPHLTGKSAELCYTCHEDLAEKFRRQGGHAPVANGACDACHVAHGSDHEGFTKDTPAALCGSCHTIDSTLNSKHGNYNLASADCLDCHNPHISEKPKLQRANIHPPFESKDCEGCHTLGAGNVVQISGNINEICATCHDKIDGEMKQKNLHAPFRDGQCVSCHSAHEADNPKLLRKEGDKLCYSCHDKVQAQTAMAVQHKPFKEGKCLDCHRPHSSNYPALTNKPKESFCLNCHTELKAELGKGSVHKPVMNGDCGACHLSHAGELPALLVKSKEQLCGQCHDLTSPTLITAHSGFNISQSDCQNCHAPHVGTKGTRGLLLPDAHKPFALRNCESCHMGKQKDQFVAEIRDLCFSCHKDFAAKLDKAVVHLPFGEKNGCVECHGPHVGFGKGLQIKNGVKTCLTCHNSKEFTGQIKHPVAFEDCMNCHQPHSADYKYLLDTKDIMELCMNCHPDAKKTHYHPMGEGITDPRTRQPLNCVGCHSPHSSDYASLLIADKDRKLCVVCHNVAHD